MEPQGLTTFGTLESFRCITITIKNVREMHWKDFMINRLSKVVQAKQLLQFANVQKCHTFSLFLSKNLMIMIRLQSMKALKENIIQLSENACFAKNESIYLSFCVAQNELKY